MIPTWMSFPSPRAIITTPTRRSTPRAPGKDIYCEKPFTHWRQFAALKRAVAEVKRNNTIFQLGTQGMTDGAWHQARKLIEDGLIGQPIHAECGMFRDSDWGERGMPIDDKNAKPGADLNWNAFLGDAPRRKFDVSRFFRWRLYEDYSGGSGDRRVSAQLHAGRLHDECRVPELRGRQRRRLSLARARCARQFQPLRRLPAEDDPRRPRHVRQRLQRRRRPARFRGAHAVLRGWEGALTFQGNEIVYIPCTGAKRQAQKFPIEHGENAVDHWDNLLTCVRNRDPKTNSPIDLAFQVQTTLIMAMWSLKHRKVARFDTRRQEIVI